MEKREEIVTQLKMAKYFGKILLMKCKVNSPVFQNVKQQMAKKMLYSCHNLTVPINTIRLRFIKKNDTEDVLQVLRWIWFI